MQINAVFEGGELRGSRLPGLSRRRRMPAWNSAVLPERPPVRSWHPCWQRGYRADEIKRIIEETPFHSFLQRAPIFNTKFIGPALRVLIKKGLYSGEALENWIREILLAKGIFTFSDIPAGKLYIVASDITNGRSLVLPDDLRQYGINPATFPVAKAVRMSADSVFFDPVILRLLGRAAKGKSFGEQFVYIVDGDCSATFRYGSLIASRRGT